MSEVVDADLPSGELRAHIENILQTRTCFAGARITSLRPFGDGHSGFTYLAVLAPPDPEIVLRLSAPGSRQVGPNDLVRQGKVMQALGEQAFCVPRIYAFGCSSELGSRSYIAMERVDGRAWNTLSVPAERVASSAVAALRALHEIPVERSGLNGEAPFSPASELDRWARLLPRCPKSIMARAGKAVELLRAGAPPLSRVCVGHGDFHFGNLLYSNDGSVAAVLDWEVVSIGDPLMDLASLAVAAWRRRYAPEPNPTGDVDVDPETFAQLYETDVDKFRWYVAATCVKYSLILGYNLMLHRRGKRIDPVYDQLTRTISGLADDALALAGASI
jgi:aminoglycoside phosphotransferase (APT) family kinase protein